MYTGPAPLPTPASMASSLLSAPRIGGASLMSASAIGGATTGDAPDSQFGSVKNFELEGKTVFVRADLNVKMEGDRIVEDERLVASLPTIEYVLEKGGAVVLASHLGRPKGRPDPKFSLEPVAYELAGHLTGKAVVSFVDDCVGENTRRAAGRLIPGRSVLLLENLRFHEEETQNDIGFAKELASLADVYINDAFGTAHRAHASTEGMTRFFIEKGVGLLMAREISVLSGLVDSPAKPFVALLGGSKVSDKLGVIESLMRTCDTILIGGAMAFTFLSARKMTVGRSLVEEGMIGKAKEIMERAEASGVRMLLPSDHIAATDPDSKDDPIVIDSPELPAGLMGLDIGPATLAEFSKAIRGSSGTVFWNGPVGLFELPAFASGSIGLAVALAESGAFTVIGGGDSIKAIKRTGLAGMINHISTGGGASLYLISGRSLPALEALKV